MKRLLLLLAAMCLPAAASAQVVVGSDYEYMLSAEAVSTNSFYWTAKFRNTQAFEANRVFGIQDVFVQYHTFSGYTAAPPTITFEGVVGRSTLSGGYVGAPPLPFNANWFLIPTDFGFSIKWGGSSTSNTFQDGYGLLGCSAPIRHVGELSPSYAGSTCQAAGQTGWVVFKQLVTLNTPPANGFTPDIFGFGVYGVSQARAAQFITPEPSTYALMATGLVMVGLMYRRRTRV
jgi:hypothetical protein